jgi:hypothetical protein
MAKITKRYVESAPVKSVDYIIWDDDLSGFGVRIFASGKRSYLIQYRAQGRSRRFTIGPHGVWTPELARRQARAQLGRVARGDNPAEERQLDHQAIMMKELCLNYLADLNAGLILGKGGRPKKPSTIGTDEGRIKRHIIPLLGRRRVKDVTRGRRQQRHEGHHSGQDWGDCQDRQAAGKGDRTWRRRHCITNHWIAGRHYDLCLRSRDYRCQSGAWYS